MAGLNNRFPPLHTNNGEIANQVIALQQAQDKQRAELEGIIKQQAGQLDEAKRHQDALTKQLDEVQQKVATISGSDAKTGNWRRRIFSLNWPDASSGATSGRHHRGSTAEKRGRQPRRR